MATQARHDITVRGGLTSLRRTFSDERFIATCRSCAVGTGAVAYRTADMWVQAHKHDTCAECHHAASSHGSIPVWDWHAEHSELGDGTACGTCKCSRYRG